MTHVVIFKTRQNSYTGFNCIGHADFANHGEDIVCASISVLVINTINSMEVLAKEHFSLVSNEEEGLIDCRFDHPMNEKAILLMDSLVLGLEQIESQYGKTYLDLKFKEV
ncbi:MAG: ribosomal-processing cysteine protease Prp [Eubacteriales bacterium]